MKRFLGVLFAAMFLASAAYAADTKEDSKATEKGKSDVKKSDSKAKSSDTKGGAMGDEKAGDKKAGATGDEKKAK